MENRLSEPLLVAAVREIGCKDLGNCACSRVSVKQFYCKRSIRTTSSIRLNAKLVRLREEEAKLFEQFGETGLALSTNRTEIMRASAQLWWGNGVTPDLADALTDYCKTRQICAHDLRRIVNAGILEPPTANGQPFSFNLPWRQWLDIFNYGGAAAMLLLIGVSPWFCCVEPLDSATKLFGTALILCATLALIACLRGPLLLLFISRQLKPHLGGFVLPARTSGSVIGAIVTRPSK